MPLHRAIPIALLVLSSLVVNAAPRCADDGARSSLSAAQLADLLARTQYAGGRTERGEPREFALKAFALAASAVRDEALRIEVRRALADTAPLNPKQGIPAVVDVGAEFPEYRTPLEKTLRESASSASRARAEELIKLLWTKPVTGRIGAEELRGLLAKIGPREISRIGQLPAIETPGLAISLETAGPHDASRDNPRFLRYGRQIVIAHHLGGGTPQVIDFDRAQDRFALYEIENKDGALTLHPAPAAKCARCHGEDPRPSWRLYNHWPGTMGAFDDRIPPGSPEEKKLQTVLERVGKTPGAPYTPDEIAAAYRTHAAAEKLTDAEPADYRAVAAPNETLGARLNVLNLYRLVRLIRQTPDYCRFKHAIYAALSGCPDLPSFLPPAAGIPKSAWAKAKRATARDKAALDKAFRKATGFRAVDRQTQEDPFRQGPAYFYDEAGATALRYLFESRGIDVKSWTMDPDGHLGFNDGTHNLATLLTLLKNADGELQELGNDADPASCDRLRQRSLARW